VAALNPSIRFAKETIMCTRLKPGRPHSIYCILPPHMLEHIAKIEHRMVAENRLFLSRWGRLPSLDEFMRIPARPPEVLIEAAKAAMNASPTDVAAVSEPE